MSSNPMGTCPLGGLWYTCEEQSPTFLGCCLSNPCNGIGCPAVNLTAAGMGTASGPDATSNDGSYWPNVACPNGGIWYTCSQQTRSFQGCCSNITGVNPCSQNGCSAKNLYPAAFKSVPVPSATSEASASTEKRPIGAIVGGTLGGVAVTLLVILAILYLQRRKKRAPVAGAVQPYYAGVRDMSKEARKSYRPVSHAALSPPLSPAPPYKSATQSPVLSNFHEIDSLVVHEVESPALGQQPFVYQPTSVELSDTSENAIRNSIPQVLMSGTAGK